jgi:hypothetical protein
MKSSTKQTSWLTFNNRPILGVEVKVKAICPFTGNGLFRQLLSSVVLSLSKQARLFLKIVFVSFEQTPFVKVQFSLQGTHPTE